jgi:outer membrane usher protein
MIASFFLLNSQHGFAKTELVDAKEEISEAERFDELLLQVEINGEALDEPVLFFHDLHGKFYMRAEDIKHLRLLPPNFSPIAIKQLRLLPPNFTPIAIDNGEYFDLSGYEGLKFTFNQENQSISIVADIKLFTSTGLSLPLTNFANPSKVKLGGFLNYDMVRTEGHSEIETAGQFELGIFNQWGVCTSNILVPQMSKSSNLIRLDSTCTKDDPAKMQTWRMGDIISRSGDWGLPVRLSGIQFSTNFTTQPGFITFPVRQFSGVATLPSTVDVYVNNNLMAHSSVPAGPFDITNIPVVNGKGVVSMVVRDALGREQLITQPFYGNGGLLAKGLANYSYEVGYIRENFGINSNDFGKLVAVGTHRYGFNEVFTGEIHTEIQGNVNNVGINGLYLVPQLGVFNTSLATSQGNDGNGFLKAVGLDYQASPFNYGFRTQWASGSFSQLGLNSGQSPIAHQTSANFGYTFASLGSVGFSYLMRSQQDQPDIKIMTANYSTSFHKLGTVNLSVIHTQETTSSSQLFLTWTLPFASDHSVSVMQNNNYTKTKGETTETVATLQKNLPVGEGYGYMVQVKDYTDSSSSSSKDVRANLTYQNNYGTYGLDALQQDGAKVETRISAAGGIVFLGGDTFFSRRINSSFGVIQVPGFSNVSIYGDNQLVGKTNSSGNALIPRLRPYENNLLRIEEKDLPMDAQIDTTQMDAVPYFRSGVVLEFPVRISNGATFRVILDDGLPIPVGSTIENQEAKNIFPVAYDGEVYFTGLIEHNHMIAKWHEQSCEFDVDFKHLDNTIPDLGVFVCKGVVR